MCSSASFRSKVGTPSHTHICEINRMIVAPPASRTQRSLLRQRSSSSGSSPTTPDTTPLLSREQSSDNPRARGAMHQYVIVMRHGERRDALPDAPPEVDPPLTEKGKAEVAHAAQRIRQMIGTTAAKKLMVVCSPFVRTMETAAELQRYQIGTDRPGTVDNTICEVFGPLRIKSTQAPELDCKDAVGDLPRWGESIQDATQRFCDSFLRNANSNPHEHVILVSHGDAISAVLSHFYPARVVYSAEFLSFLILKRVAVGADRFVLHGSHGVEWLLDHEELPAANGDDDDDGDSSATPFSSATAKPEIHGSPGHQRINSQGSQQQQHRPGYDTVDNPVRGAADDPAIPQWTSASAGESGVGVGGGGRHGSRRMTLLLHFLTFLSQVPVVRLWPSALCAVLYLANLLALELASLKYGWRTAVDKLPFSYGSPRRRVLYRLARYPLARATWKLMTLIVTYTVTAIPLALLIGRVTPSNVMKSLGTIVLDIWNLVLVLLMVFLDTWRGYLENDETVDDPHRESI